MTSECKKKKKRKEKKERKEKEKKRKKKKKTVSVWGGGACCKIKCTFTGKKQRTFGISGKAESLMWKIEKFFLFPFGSEGEMIAL